LHPPSILFQVLDTPGIGGNLQPRKWTKILNEINTIMKGIRSSPFYYFVK
jgi:hypothetical protein